MDKTNTLQKNFNAPSANVDPTGFMLNLGIGLVLALVLGVLYTRYGSTLSNRKQVARVFVLIAVTTILVISIVKSSLALSLGLVGALSIVRFRTPIKEPEELAYLFLSIAVGLGLGANQRLTTVIAFLFIAGIIFFHGQFVKRRQPQNLFLTVSLLTTGSDALENIVAILSPICNTLKLQRVDDNSDTLEAVFNVGFDGFDELNRGRNALRQLDPSVRVTFIEADPSY